MTYSNDRSDRAQQIIDPPARRRAKPEPMAAEFAGEGRAEMPASPTYDIGYGKPPVATRFKPGNSGNPKGRPRGAKGLNKIVRETLTTKVAVRTQGREIKMSKMEAVLQKTVELAMKGNPRAIMMLVSLYRPAVPDLQETAAGNGGDQDLTATDLQILEMFRDEIRADLERRP